MLHPVNGKDRAERIRGHMLALLVLSKIPHALWTAFRDVYSLLLEHLLRLSGLLVIRSIRSILRYWS